MTKTKSSFPTKLFLLSFIIYIGSFALPVFTMADYDGSRTTNGVEAFFMGATAILGGGLLEWLTWLANPLFFLSIVLKRRQKKNAILIGWVATFVALSFSFWTEVLAAESGRTAPIENKGVGYFLWVVSMVVWTLGISFDDTKPVTNIDSK